MDGLSLKARSLLHRLKAMEPMLGRWNLVLVSPKQQRTAYVLLTMQGSCSLADAVALQYRSDLRTWYCHQATVPSQRQLSAAPSVAREKMIAAP